MIWVNFKIQKETFGEGALRLSETCRKVSLKTKVKVVPVVSPFDLRLIKEKVGGEVWIQHIDPFMEGPKTGWLSPAQAIAAGADGSLINHSEHKIPFGQVRQILAFLKRDEWIKKWGKLFSSMENGKLKIDKFSTMVCFRTKGQAGKWVKKLNPKPEYVAYEPTELIGSDTSVSEAKPEAIKRIVKLLSDHDVVVGAGVRERKDVEVALRLGAKGILVSSDVVKAKNPEKELLDLARPFC